MDIKTGQSTWIFEEMDWRQSMKCLYIKTRPFNEEFVGGVRAHTVGMINGFADAGLDITVLCECVISDIRAEQKCIYKYRSDKEYNEEIYRKTKEYLSSCGETYDFIYSRFSYTASAPARLAVEYGIPHITEFNSSSLTSWKEVRLPEIMRTAGMLKRIAAKCITPFRCAKIDRQEMSILNKSSLIVTVSNVLKDELIERNIDGDKILVCPNGIDPKVFQYDEEGRKRVRTQLGISENEVLIGFSGTYGKWHGIPVLSTAITKLKEKSNLKFLLIGSGLMHHVIQEEQANNPQTIILNRVPFQEMPAHLSACDIVLVTNDWNPTDNRPFFGSPTKMFEYMATGRAIIASRLDQIADILSDGETCIAFEPGNAEMLADAILRLSKDSELRRVLGENARKNVVQKYTWKRNCEEIKQYISDRGLKCTAESE